MIRLSAGTAARLGLSANRMDAYPTTAYLLSGNRCRMSCAFCPRGQGESGESGASDRGGGSEALNRLGRISWPQYAWPEVEGALAGAQSRGIGRICLQSVRQPGGITPLLEEIRKIKEISALPLSLSTWIDSEEEAAAVVERGVERLAIALDVANPELYRRIKGGSFEQKLSLLLSCAATLPGRISTHLICGLGENEEELVGLAARLLKAGITLALFAFVPLKGTRLEQAKAPSVARYRRVQAALYLLKEKIITVEMLKFERGRLTGFGLTADDMLKTLAGGEAFRTGGCPDCNRPYYNERPGGTIYNYHRPLHEEEVTAALELVVPGIRGGSGKRLPAVING